MWDSVYFFLLVNEHLQLCQPTFNQVYLLCTNIEEKWRKENKHVRLRQGSTTNNPVMKEESTWKTQFLSSLVLNWSWHKQAQMGRCQQELFYHQGIKNPYPSFIGERFKLPQDRCLWLQAWCILTSTTVRPECRNSWMHPSLTLKSHGQTRKSSSMEISLTLIPIKFSSQVEAQDIHYT